MARKFTSWRKATLSRTTFASPTSATTASNTKIPSPERKIPRTWSCHLKDDSKDETSQANPLRAPRRIRLCLDSHHVFPRHADSPHDRSRANGAELHSARKRNGNGLAREAIHPRRPHVLPQNESLSHFSRRFDQA